MVLRWTDFITLFALSLHQRQVPTQTLSLCLSAVLCLSGNKNVWDLWGVNLLVGEGGCQTLMNSGGFYLCIDTAKWLVAIMTECLPKVGKNLERFQWCVNKCWLFYNHVLVIFFLLPVHNIFWIYWKQKEFCVCMAVWKLGNYFVKYKS